MLFKMILDGAKADERPIARGFLKHLVVGIGAGLALGGVVLIGLFAVFAKLELDVPLIFLAAAMLQFAPIGGLIGVGIHLSRITDRSAAEEDTDDEGPGGGTRAPVTGPNGLAARPPRSALLPSPA